MRSCFAAAVLVLLAQPAAAAGGGAQAAEAVPQESAAGNAITAPVERNPLPPALLERMRAKLVALRDGGAQVPATPAPSGH